MDVWSRATEFEGRMPPIHGIRKDEGKEAASLPAIRDTAMLPPGSS
jgi:hypothetical protein